MDQIKSLAAEMGVTEADVSSFIACLSVWIAKGLTFEQAVERHMAQMHRFINHYDKLLADARGLACETFYAS